MTIRQHLLSGHTLERIKQEAEQEALSICGGNVVQAAKLLGVSRGRFYERLMIDRDETNTLEKFDSPFPGMTVESLSELMREERKFELSRLNAENALLLWHIANAKPLNAAPVPQPQTDEVKA